METYARAVRRLAWLWNNASTEQYGIAFDTLVHVNQFDPVQLAQAVMKRRRVFAEMAS